MGTSSKPVDGTGNASVDLDASFEVWVVRVE